MTGTYPLQDFTPDQLARLRAIEAAPFAPEARFLHENKLVPTGEVRPAHLVVPEPSMTEGTAQQWQRFYLAQAHARLKLADHLRPRDVFTPETMGPYVDVLTSAIEAFSLGFAFRHLDDDRARELSSILDMADNDELTHTWLRELDVDPDHIASAAPTGARP